PTDRDGDSHRRWGDAAIVLGLALVPVILYKIFLQFWLGDAGSPGPRYPDWTPLGGLFSYAPLHGEQIDQVVRVVLPALLCALLVWRQLNCFAAVYSEGQRLRKHRRGERTCVAFATSFCAAMWWTWRSRWSSAWPSGQ